LPSGCVDFDFGLGFTGGGGGLSAALGGGGGNSLGLALSCSYPPTASGISSYVGMVTRGTAAGRVPVTNIGSGCFGSTDLRYIHTNNSDAM